MTRPLIAVVGGESLLARDLRELLTNRKPAPRLQLIYAGSDSERSAVFSQEEDEPGLMASLTPESLAGAQVAFLAGSAASSRRTLRMTGGNGPTLIDLTAALEEQPNARLRAPTVEPRPLPLSPEHIHVIAHPAAIALTMFLAQLDSCATIRRAIVEIFEPASERGQRGLGELQQQTVALLNFQTLDQDVYDTQVSFNLLPRYGEEAIEPLADIELRIDRHLATLLGAWPRVPMPSLRLIQAPVFHGYSLSVWAEFEEHPGLVALHGNLASSDIEIRGDAEEPPSNAGAAGQSGLTVGAMTTDRNNARACWFWIVADNLRLAAANALGVAQEAL